MDTGIDASKKVAHEAGGFIGNKVVNAIAKSSNEKLIEKSRNHDYTTGK